MSAGACRRARCRRRRESRPRSRRWRRARVPRPASACAAACADCRVRGQPEMLSRQEHRRAEALDLQRPVELVGDARPEPVRLEEREGDEARGRDDGERDPGRGRRAAAAAAPEMDDREREQDARPKLRGEPEPEECAGEDRPLLDERRQSAEREQRRPEVVARAEQRAEHERRDREEEHGRPDPSVARSDPAQRRRDERDAAGAAEPHEDRERGRIAPAHVRREEPRDERGGRIGERRMRLVAVRDVSGADERRVVVVAADVRSAPCSSHRCTA